MTYAARTKVPVNQTRLDIERTLHRYGATEFAYGTTAGKAMIQFRANRRVIRFVLPLTNPHGAPKTETQRADFERSRWRCLLLSIKAKLEAAESGISTFEEEFMAHIVLPSGRTVGETSLPLIAKGYDTGTVPPMLGFGP